MSEFKDILGQADHDIDDLVQGRIGQMLKQKNLTIAVAESITGGLIASGLTREAGSSQFFVGGLVCYHPRIKVNYAGVEAKTIADHGVVSEPVAKEMALGIKKRFGTDVGLSVTGVAGPEPHGGASVGTVWAAISTADETRAKSFYFEGSRSEIRTLAAEAALGLVWMVLGENSF